MVKPNRRTDAVTPLLAATLRAESARRQIRQTEVAEVIGRTQSYVSHRWNGLASLTLDEFAAWASLLGITPQALLADALADWTMPRPIRGRHLSLAGQESDPTPTLARVADTHDDDHGNDPDSGYDNA